MRNILRIIDSFSVQIGSLVQWLAPLLVLVMTYEVTMRYVFNKPTIWTYETSMMLGGVIYALAWAYVHRNRSHIRVDIFYAHISPRRRLIIDVIGTLFFFFPLILILIKTSIVWTADAWTHKEVLQESIWYPPAAPFRALISLGYILLFLQGIANFIRDCHHLIRNRPYD